MREKVFNRCYLCYNNFRKGTTMHGRRLVPPVLEGFVPPERRAMLMVTYSELIQLGILIVGIIGLFIQARKK